MRHVERPIFCEASVHARSFVRADTCYPGAKRKRPCTKLQGGNDDGPYGL